MSYDPPCLISKVDFKDTAEEAYSRKESVENIKRKKILRLKEAYRGKESVDNIKRNKILRLKEAYREKESVENIKRNKILRLKEAYRGKESVENIKRNKILRLKEAYREKESVINIKHVSPVFTPSSPRRSETDSVCPDEKKNTTPTGPHQVNLITAKNNNDSDKDGSDTFLDNDSSGKLLDKEKIINDSFEKDITSKSKNEKLTVQDNNKTDSKNSNNDSNDNTKPNKCELHSH
ncbi:uncharacterized protein DDB_G0290803-like [Leptopilina heterotoma]|uniref:uncharacterized protein DDB_G0290803-like n=1 Tax=Leptopilina heterotoma TaxID=63436 RepID=UPI001CA8F56E|nr:uncharacterized protein DDB_G0290803-like [Leptopilina heterotoma]